MGCCGRPCYQESDGARLACHVSRLSRCPLARGRRDIATSLQTQNQAASAAWGRFSTSSASGPLATGRSTCLVNARALKASNTIPRMKKTGKIIPERLHTQIPPWKLLHFIPANLQLNFSINLLKKHSTEFGLFSHTRSAFSLLSVQII